MLDNEAMRQAIRDAIKASTHTHAYIAAELGITEQAITGWLRTGRIDKRRLPALARVTGVPLSTFMPDVAGTGPMRVRSEDPPPYLDYCGKPANPSAEALWAAYCSAGQATQRAVDLLLLDLNARALVIQGRSGLVAGIDLLESGAGEALSARKSA